MKMKHVWFVLALAMVSTVVVEAAAEFTMTITLSDVEVKAIRQWLGAPGRKVPMSEVKAYCKQSINMMASEHARRYKKEVLATLSKVEEDKALSASNSVLTTISAGE